MTSLDIILTTNLLPTLFQNVHYFTQPVVIFLHQLLLFFLLLSFLFTLLLRRNLKRAFISFGSHSSRGNSEQRRHLHGPPGLAGERGLRFSGETPRPGLRDSHSPERDLDDMRRLLACTAAGQCGSVCPP